MNPVDLPDYSGGEEVLLSPIYEAIWLGLPLWSILVIFVGLGFVVWGIYRLLGDSRKKNSVSRKTQGDVG